VSLESRSGEQVVARGSNLAQRFNRLFQRRVNFRVTMQATQRPARWECGGSQGVVLDRMRAIEPDNCQDTAGFQEIPKTLQGESERKVMQRRDRRDEIEVAIGKWECHHITIHKRDSRFRISDGPRAQESVMIDIDANHLVAMPCKLPRESP